MALCHSLVYIWTGTNMFCYVISAMFFNKLIWHLATPFHIVCSDKSQRHDTLKDDILHNEIIQAVPDGQAPHVR